MIEFVDLAHAEELDEFVRRHEKCHFMQTSLWGRAKSDWGWYGILCRDSAGNIVGTLALLRHNLRYFHTCMLYAPRGPIFTDGDTETFHALITAAKTLAKHEGAYCLRIDPRIGAQDTRFADEVKKDGFFINTASDFSLFQPRLCYVLRLEGHTPETLAAQYHRTTRYNIHHALRSDITVHLGSQDDLPRFCQMMEQVAEKNGFEARKAPYFASVLRELQSCARLYLAEEEGNVVAGALMVLMGARAWFMYGCSDTEARKDHPNELLQWRMQCDALEMGCKWFDFRGVEGYPTEDNPKLGLHRYKQGFGAEFCEYIGQCDLAVRPLLCKLIPVAQRFYHK